MIQRLVVAVVAALCLPSVGAEAPESAYSDEYTACQANSGGVDPVMLDCINAEYDRQDKRLNDAYASLFRQMGAKARAALKSAQRDWIRSQKSTCDMFYRVGGGTSANLQAQDCYLSWLVDRVSLLEYWKTLYASTHSEADDH